MSGVGILGGTFDPIHNGHLAVAEEARVAFGLAQVLIIPAAHQPLKPHQPAASAAQRMTMVELACAGNPALVPERFEIERAGPSYTVTTLRALHNRFSSALFLILGADAAASLPHWRGVAEIAELARIVAVGRPGVLFDATTLIGQVPALATRLSLLEGPNLAIASSEIRQRVAAARPIRYLTPDPVVEYIAAQQLYQNDRQHAAE